MIKRLIWTIWTPMSSVLKKADKLNLSFSLSLKAIGEFKPGLQSRKAQFGSKSATFLPCVTLKLDGWPWKTIAHLFYATSSYVQHF